MSSVGTELLLLRAVLELEFHARRLLVHMTSTLRLLPFPLELQRLGLRSLSGLVSLALRVLHYIWVYFLIEVLVDFLV